MASVERGDGWKSARLEFKVERQTERQNINKHASFRSSNTVIIINDMMTNYGLIRTRKCMSDNDVYSLRSPSPSASRPRNEKSAIIDLNTPV